LLLGFICGFEVLRLVLTTGDWIWILLLGVFGADTGLTLLKRVWKGDNPLKAHREHLYERYVHEGEVSHLAISWSYILFQGLINTLACIQYVKGIFTGTLAVIVMVTVLAAVYLILHYRLNK
jgi:UDP-GlcNAc:undecaprenyl-phosphate/decaprenyl-phosphate GlcNAc-1-phosphate transferase